MNRLLKRQLKRKQLDLESLPKDVQELLLAVSDSYDHFEMDRQLIERAMDLSDRELSFSNQKLRAQAFELVRSNRELKRFAFITAHDLKEPLRTIASFIQLVDRRESNLSPESKEFIQFAIKGAKNMRELLDDLMQYSMIDGGTHSAPENVPLDDILQQVLLNLNTKIEENEVKVEFSELPEVMAERSQMIQLFQNMIDNSIKFRSENSPHIRILSNPVELAGLVKLSVVDNGIGIASDYQHKVFQIFERLHGNDKYEGTGIGLAICQKIVERHTGEISIDSDYLSGLKLDFTLPLAQVSF